MSAEVIKYLFYASSAFKWFNLPLVLSFPCERDVVDLHNRIKNDGGGFVVGCVVVVGCCCCRCCCPLLLLLSFFFFFSSSLLLVLTLTAAVVCCFHVCITSSKIINYYIITRAFSFFITRTKTILFSWWPFYLLLSHTSRGRRARRPRSTKCT